MTAAVTFESVMPDRQELQIVSKRETQLGDDMEEPWIVLQRYMLRNLINILELGEVEADASLDVALSHIG